MVMRKGEGSDYKDKMSKKNKELSEYLDEIKVNYILIKTQVHSVKYNNLVW